MGGCANSKYAVGEGDSKKESNKPLKPVKEKKGKKDKNKDGKNGTVAANDAAKTPAQTADGVAIDTSAAGDAKKASLEEGLEYIDKEELDKQKDGNNNDNCKKEVTTYQTTVVKHVEKENAELLAHLKDEAFQTLKNLLKQKLNNEKTSENIKTTSTIDGEKITTSTYNSTSDSNSNNERDLLNDIKLQVLNAINNSLKQQPQYAFGDSSTTNNNNNNNLADENLINSIIDTSASLIKENKVSNMNELEDNLNTLFTNQNDLIKKIINSTTGFLTAKGTEAGTLLSNILANLSDSTIQGALKETEKTTVKVTRTITEKIINSKGETKIITKTVTDTVQAPSAQSSNVDELVKKLSTDEATPTATVTTVINEEVIPAKTTVNETEAASTAVEANGDLNSGLTGILVASKLSAELAKEQEQEAVENQPLNNDERETIEHAKIVVDTVVSAALTKLNNELESQSNEPEDNSETKAVEPQPEEPQSEEVQQAIVNTNVSSSRDDIASEFYKRGKGAAEELIKIIDNNLTATSPITEEAQEAAPAPAPTEVTVESNETTTTAAAASEEKSSEAKQETNNSSN